MKLHSICAKIITAFFLVLIGALALAGGPVFYYVADPENAEYDLDAYAPDDALHFKGYGETPYGDTLYYQFDLGDGSDFFCHYIYADFGFGLKTFALDYKLRYPDGKTAFWGHRFDTDESHISSGRFERKIGPNWIKGDNNRHQMHIESGPLEVNVDFETLVPFYAPGENGMMYIGAEREKSAHLTHFPLFSAKGTIRDGSTVIEVDGWGYGNRGWQKRFLVTYFSKFHTALRFQKEGLGFDMYDYITTDELGAEWLPYLMVYKDGKLIHVSQNYEKENLDYYFEPKTEGRIPTSYRVKSVKDDITVEIEFTQVRVTDYNDPLMILSKFERYLIRLVAEAPLDIRFDGHVKIKVTSPEGTIIKEGPGHGLSLVSL